MRAFTDMVLHKALHLPASSLDGSEIRSHTVAPPNRLLIAIVLFAASTAASASNTFKVNDVTASGFTNILVGIQSIPDLSFTLSPNFAYYPPGSNTAACQQYGTAPCVIFSGTLTDNDTDSSFLFLNSISLILNSGDAAFFAIDNTFFNLPPGSLEGDTNNSPFPNTYTGPIFGVDIISPPPPGVYIETAEISACGGTNDPGCAGFTVDAQFTIQTPAPEPASGLMILGGLLVMVAIHRVRRSRTC